MTGREQENRRKNPAYFLENNYEARFIIQFCSVVLIATIAVVCILYILFLTPPTSRFHSLGSLLSLLGLQTLSIVGMIMAVVTIIVMLFVSKKVAGPLYRFKKVADSMAEGDFSSDFKLRTSDKLHEFADSFNRMIVNNRKHLIEIRNSSDMLKKHIQASGQKQVIEHFEDLYAKICYFKLEKDAKEQGQREQRKQ